MNILLYLRRKWFVLYPGHFTQSMNIKLSVWHRNFIITSKATSPSYPLVRRKEKLLQHFTHLSFKFFSVISPVIQGRPFQPCPVVRSAAVLGAQCAMEGLASERDCLFHIVLGMDLAPWHFSIRKVPKWSFTYKAWRKLGLSNGLKATCKSLLKQQLISKRMH